MTAVNSWNEWDPLREIIVGTARGAVDMRYEPALWPYYSADDPPPEGGRPVHPALVDEAERQLDAFARLLEARGIVVQRPDPVDHSVVVRTPDWEAAAGRASACPRDSLLVIGDEIIEAPMAQRGRYYEFRAYRSLVRRYFAAGARWTSAPKPLMGDDLYVARGPAFDFAKQPLLTELEPAFDAACFVRCGRDIFWQPDLVSNTFGAAWLQRHLGPGFRVHRVAFEEQRPTHIDTTLVPIRPGLALINPERPAVPGALDVFVENGWQLVAAPAPARKGRAPARDVSHSIALNILMLDERTAVVEQAETAMMDLLRALGCEVIPCPFDRVYPFGGGFHCCTTDIRRDGTLKSYFPTLDTVQARAPQ